ncbi:GerAB/ArcD/ProY family transporter [Paenibacillus hexagrammi]|uniref:Spore germination protein n=1 Tax=Paenibacillus hexagrammi TaxID=2908839 RepID=A0ABY3SCF6_9BACL|nr:GerAB/ArcD/ProY family transporter [Paenibacillus sp. YPD9-1]UJF31683.1 spore germination protein [Paenibacillus sp. YPD9-1]
MSDVKNISSNQLFAVIVLFEFGTALVVPIGLKAEQGVWLSILAALPGGIAIYLVYDYLFRQYPNVILSGYIRKIVGPYIGFPMIFLYIAYFLYNASRNLREAGDLLITVAYDQTPMLVIHAVMIIAVVYVLNKGIEVFFRLGEIYLIITVCLGLIGGCTLLLSGVVEPRNLLPIYGAGWKSILQMAYPNIFLFPFAELVCFTTVFPRLNRTKAVRISGLAGIIISGLILSMTHALEIATLGSNIYGRSIFPLFTTISLANVADFLQRMDAIVVLTLIIGVFFKMSMYCYAAMVITADVFQIKEERKLAYPVGAVVLLVSILSAWSFPEHLQEGVESSMFFLGIVSFCIPVLLFLVQLIRRRLSPPSLLK